MDIQSISAINKSAYSWLGKDNLLHEGTDVDSAIKQVDELFCKLEERITSEHKKPFVTDTLENQISIFARECVKHLFNIKNKEEILEIEESALINFFSHRHLGYGFYSSFSETEWLIGSYKKDPTLTLYKSLANYYDNFFGSFHDNELAIQMLCEHYPNESIHENLNIGDKQSLDGLTISALYKHILNAGTPSDFGYAYQGISKIKYGINNLPIEIVNGVLKNYIIYNIINFPIYRNQIFTIVDNGKLSQEDKEKYKFFFIDSIMLMNIICRMLYKRDVNDVLWGDWNSAKCGSDKIVIWEKGESNNGDCFLEYSDFTERRVIIGTKKIVVGYVNNTKKIKIINESEEEYTVTFDYDDYVLNGYAAKEFEKDIEEFINNGKIGKNAFLFSHIWLDGYRGVSQQLSLDMKFKVIKSGKSTALKKTNKDKPQMPKEFYGKNIYSLSAIVGKNGSGKTSLLDFLRYDFFKLMYKIDISNNRIEKGVVLDEKELAYKYIISFWIGEKAYFITNVEGLDYKSEEILPYRPGLLNKKSESCKVFYFSNMINYEIGDTFQFENNSAKNNRNEDSDLLKSMQKVSFVDFSARNSFREGSSEYLKYIDIIYEQGQKEVESTKFKNTDFWIQLAFLQSFKDDELEELFGEGFSKYKLKYEIKDADISSELLGFCNEGSDMFKEIFESEYKNPKPSILNLKHFSSGQYAKLSFLSKLYWCLDGYDKYQETINLYDKNLFEVTRTISNCNTALIFIDEGELYYHPEWQRTYIDTLIKFINTYTNDKEITLQIVITSNSPFIVSDIPSENITFLPDLSSKEATLTFGANIHTMLRNGFFMDSTIGEFANKKIKHVSETLNKSILTDEDRDEIRYILSILGESIIKAKIEEKYNETPSFRIEQIDNLIEKLKAEKEYLENDSNNK